MSIPKSPFYIVREFISPKICEEIVENLEFYSPDLNSDGDPIKMVKHHDQNELKIYNKFEPLIPNIEQYYDIKHKGTETITFEYYVEDVNSDPICESCTYLREKWVRTKDRDLTALLFLSTYQDKEYFDSDYEVYGGKVEFPQWNFGFNSERGTLIIYPSGPHFINVVSPIYAGTLHLAKFHIAAQTPFLFDSTKFPGTFESWFKNLY